MKYIADISAMTKPKLVKIQIQLPDNLRTRFKSKCVLEGVTMNAVIVDLIGFWTDKERSDAAKEQA